MAESCGRRGGLQGAFQDDEPGARGPEDRADAVEGATAEDQGRAGEGDGGDVGEAQGREWYLLNLFVRDKRLTQRLQLGNGILKPFGLSTDNFQMVKDEATGGYSMNFTQGQGK